VAKPEPLRSTEPPWVHLVVLGHGETAESALAVPPGFTMRSIDGRRARTKPGLLSEFARALDFPSGSGRNWDAFEELLADLEWLPGKGYLLIVTEADQLLAEHPDPDEEEIRHYLSGNLCRCAAYPEIIDAVKLAAKKRRLPSRTKEER